MWRIESSVYGSLAYPKNARGLSHTDKSRFATLIAYNPRHGIRIPLRMYLPKDVSSCSKVIFSIHGVRRNANKYRNIFIPHAHDENVLIVAPELSDPFYASPLALTMGNMCTRTKQVELLPQLDWAFTHLYEVFQLLRMTFPAVQSFSVFGHSAGAQFAHRMLLFSEYQEMESVVAANPGWLTVLDREVALPYGIKDMFENEQIKNIMSRKLVIMAGDSDVDQDEKLRMSENALRQGSNRLERAQYAFSAAKRLADNLECDLNWQLVVVPKVAHSSRSIAATAVKYLL